MPKAKAKQARKVPVTMRALVQRINRKLAASEDLEKSDWQLRAVRSAKWRQKWGDFIVVTDGLRSEGYAAGVEKTRVDPEKLGRELGVLRQWEKLEE
jgi:hypothetical protein